MGDGVKKRKHTGLWIMLTLFVVLGALAYWQRENIHAVMQGIQSSPEELEQQLADNQQRVHEAVDSNADITVRDLTEEERAALRNGSQSREEIIKKLVEPYSETPKPQESTPEELATKEKYQKDLSSLVAEVYVMQAEYNAALEGMVEQAKQEYSTKSESEKSKTALIKWASGYVSRATTLEKECDAEMDAIAVKMLTLIKENGGNTSLVDEVVYTYANEKSLKKSWYLSEMQKRGLLA